MTKRSDGSEPSSLRSADGAATAFLCLKCLEGLKVGIRTLCSGAMSNTGSTGFVQPGAPQRASFSSTMWSGADGLAAAEEETRGTYNIQDEVRQPHSETEGKKTSNYDICEVFSPARVVTAGVDYGWRGGWSLDLS